MATAAVGTRFPIRSSTKEPMAAEDTPFGTPGHARRAVTYWMSPTDSVSPEQFVSRVVEAMANRAVIVERTSEELAQEVLLLVRQWRSAFETAAPPEPPAIATTRARVFSDVPTTGVGEATTSRDVGESIEWIDWDVHIEAPPPRPWRAVSMKFEQAGHRKPKIVDEPLD